MISLNAAFSDLAKEEQKLTLDDGAIQNDRFGRSCPQNDTSAATACRLREEGLVVNAMNDASGAQSRVDADFHETSSAAATYESVLGVFIGQIAALPWPASLEKDVKSLETSAGAYRKDVSSEAAISPSTPPARLAALAARSTGDLQDISVAMVTLVAALPAGHP